MKKLYMKDAFSFFIIIIGALMALTEYLFELYSDDVILTNIYLIQLFGFFTISYIYTVKKLGYLHIFSLLHITTFIFAFGGILVSFLSEDIDFKTSFSPLLIRFPETVVQKVILIYTIYVTFSFLFFFFFYSKIRGNKNKENASLLTTNNAYLELGKKTMLFMLPFAIVYSYTLLQLFSQNRTLMFQAGTSSIAGVQLYLRITNLLFTTGYFLVVASVPPKKIFIRYSFLYMISLVPILLMGERGQVVGALIFILWYLYKVYGAQIKLLKLVIIALIVMVISYVLTFTRQGESINSMSFSYLLIGFLYTASSSFSLLAYYVLFKEQVAPHNYPFFLDSLIGGLTGASGQSLQTLEVRSSIGHHLVYTLNPDYYLSGASKGTSFITEAFEFGIVGVILSTLLLSLFLNFVNNKMLHNHFRMIFLYMFFQAIILSPRGSLLPSIYEMLKFTLVYLLLLSIYKFLKPAKYV